MAGPFLPLTVVKKNINNVQHVTRRSRCFIGSVYVGILKNKAYKDIFFYLTNFTDHIRVLFSQGCQMLDQFIIMILLGTLNLNALQYMWVQKHLYII